MRLPWIRLSTKDYFEANKQIMLKIIQADSKEHSCYIRELFREYFNAINLIVSHEYDFSFDVNALLEQEIEKLQQYSPPSGCLLLAEYEGKMTGCAGLRKMSENVGEVKRMYVRPEERRKGIGRSLLQAIIAQARQINYSQIRLESSNFSKEAQALYYSEGFQKIEPYPETKLPEKYHSSWVFMKMIF